MVELKLYVLGYSATTFKLTEALNFFLASKYHTEFSLEVIDILKHPELAEEDAVFATPMLIKKSPPPLLREVFWEPEKAEVVAKNLGL